MVNGGRYNTVCVSHGASQCEGCRGVGIGCVAVERGRNHVIDGRPERVGFRAALPVRWADDGYEHHRNREARVTLQGYRDRQPYTKFPRNGGNGGDLERRAFGLS